MDAAASRAMEMAMTTTAAMASPTSTAGMGHMGHMGMGGGDECKISMLWNWNVINACFLSRSWRITSNGMFAGSCIGVILLVMSLEFLRRAGHEYDKYLTGKPYLLSRRFQSDSTQKITANEVEPVEGCSAATLEQKRRRRPTLLQHTIRSLLHMVQFAVAYFIMLLAMYYNGYIIICIFIGSFLGSFVFSWGTMDDNDTCKVTVCCG